MLDDGIFVSDGRQNVYHIEAARIIFDASCPAEARIW